MALSAPAQTLIKNAQLTGTANQVNAGATLTIVSTAAGVVASGGTLTVASGGTLTVASGGTVTVPAPVNATDAASKGYADALKQALDPKDSVRVASTANIAVATALVNAAVIDGVTVATGDRVLLKNQTAGAENGIYVVVASGAASRSTDADISAEVTSGLYAFVSAGTVSASMGYVLTTLDPITLGTTALTFTQFSGAGQITAGAGLTKTGNTLDVVGTANRVVVAADAIDIGTDVVTLTGTQTLTNKTVNLTSNTLVATSAQLAAALTDETGTGAAVFATSPALTTPAITGLATGSGVATANTVSTLVARDASGNFAAGTGTFTTLTAGSTTSLLLGTDGSAVGNIGFRNATSGTATLAPPTGALGTYSVTLPNAASTLPIFGQQITFAGPTAARTVTFPDAAFTVARTDAANTFTGVQTMTSPALTTPAITGLATGSGVATANTVSTLVSRDASGNFAAGTITAALTGTASGNLVSGGALGTPSSGSAANLTSFPTLNQSTTGSAATLTTARAIYGNNFDGSAALTQIIASTFGGTGSGFTRFSGPATTEKTKTLRDAADTILELGGSYTPTGTWTTMALASPALSGTLTGSGTIGGATIINTSGAVTGGAGAFSTLNVGGLSFGGTTLEVTTGAANAIGGTNNTASNPTLLLWNKATAGNTFFVTFFTEGTTTSRGSLYWDRTAGAITLSSNFAVTGALSSTYSGAGPGLVSQNSSDTSATTFAQFNKAAGTAIGSITRVTTTDAVSYNTSSDARLKTNVRDFTAADSGRIIDALRPRWFDWRQSADDKIVTSQLAPAQFGADGMALPRGRIVVARKNLDATTKARLTADAANIIGFIAQEEATIPELVRIGAVTVGDSHPAVITKEWQRSDTALIPILVAEIKALRARVAALEAAP